MREDDRRRGARRQPAERGSLSPHLQNLIRHALELRGKDLEHWLEQIKQLVAGDPALEAELSSMLFACFEDAIADLASHPESGLA